MLDEADYWKRVALWLASCHAATCEYEGALSRTSNASRKRLRGICEKAAAAIDGELPSSALGLALSPDWVKDRLIKAAHG